MINTYKADLRRVIPVRLRIVNNGRRQSVAPVRTKIGVSAIDTAGHYALVVFVNDVDMDILQYELDDSSLVDSAVHPTSRFENSMKFIARWGHQLLQSSRCRTLIHLQNCLRIPFF